MNYFQACNLLDQVREGASIPESVITRALELTGDLDREYCAADAVAEMEAANV